jgi:hypothetical protein
MKHDNYLGDDETKSYCDGVQTSVTRISNWRQHNKIDMVCSFKRNAKHEKSNLKGCNTIDVGAKMNTDKQQHGRMRKITILSTLGVHHFRGLDQVKQMISPLATNKQGVCHNVALPFYN